MPKVGLLAGVTAKAGQPGRTGNRVRSIREQLVPSPRVFVFAYGSPGLHRGSRPPAASVPPRPMDPREDSFRGVRVRPPEPDIPLTARQYGHAASFSHGHDDQNRAHVVWYSERSGHMNSYGGLQP